MNSIIKLTVIVVTLFIFFNCEYKQGYKYIIPIDNKYELLFCSPIKLTQKFDTIYGDYSSFKNIIHTFSNNEDSSKFRILFNQFGYDSIEIKSFKDLGKSLYEYKLNSYPDTKLIKVDSININGSSFIRVFYQVGMYNRIHVYSTIINGKVINYEFSSNNVNNSFFINSEDEFMNKIVLRSNINN